MGPDPTRGGCCEQRVKVHRASASVFVIRREELIFFGILMSSAMLSCFSISIGAWFQPEDQLKTLRDDDLVAVFQPSCW